MSKTAREIISEHHHDFAAKVDEQLGSYDADGIIAELAAAGFVIVPKEPTDAMIYAAVGLTAGPMPGFNLHPDEAKDVWSAMLTAAVSK